MAALEYLTALFGLAAVAGVLLAAASVVWVARKRQRALRDAAKVQEVARWHGFSLRLRGDDSSSSSSSSSRFGRF